MVVSKTDEPTATSELRLSAARLGELLRETREAFVRALRRRDLSEVYLISARSILDEFAGFCEGEGEGEGSDDAWQLRRRYLARRAALRREHRFSASYLENHGRELRRFVRWYSEQAAEPETQLGELSAEQLRAYWSTQQGASAYKRRILSTHRPALLAFLSRRCEADPGRDPVTLLDDYFEERRLALRGGGWGTVLIRRARTVTRRHLTWLECRGRLPVGGTAAGGAAHALRERRAMASGERSQPQALVEYCVARVEAGLPQGLRQPLIEYLEHLIFERELTHSSVRRILRTNLALCRLAAGHGLESFDSLDVGQLDELVASLVSAPSDELLRRRLQVRHRHSELRGFLRHLRRHDLVGRDLAAALISPPCYRASRPTTVLSEDQVQSLLTSVDRDATRGRRRYAIVLLMSTYGLRPVDVARLRLDAIEWRQERIALVQRKTGGALTLPLLAEVAQALYAYLREERARNVPHRQVFLACYWPYRPLRSAAISRVVKKAAREAGLGWVCARHLRSSVATHLLRQGEALSTIQEILGHRTAETTQRYAMTDVELLREVLEESER